MIASGKSTYARRRAKEGALVIAHDDLTAMLHAEYRYEQGLRELYRLAEMQIARYALGEGSEGKDVIVDRTHLTRESRQRWVKLVRNWNHWCPEYHTKLVAVTFPIEPAHVHALRRVRSDARGRSAEDWLKVACHHADQATAEPLDWQAEGFDECLAGGGLFDEMPINRVVEHDRDQVIAEALARIDEGE
jgi:predicted kinase